MKRKWIRKIINGLSFTSAMFIFQACYGTPQDYGDDLLIKGQVKSYTSGLPIKGIKVSVKENMQYVLTDENGNFSFYTEMLDSLTIKFQDIDSIQNEQFVDKDTLLTNINKNIFLNIKLEEK